MCKLLSLSDVTGGTDGLFLAVFLLEVRLNDQSEREALPVVLTNEPPLITHGVTSGSRGTAMPKDERRRRCRAVHARDFSARFTIVRLRAR